MSVAKEVLDFWFADDIRHLHFVKDADFDHKIKDKFFSVFEEAKSGKYDDLKKDATGCLALVILFDQFSRNMFRDSPESFATDDQARQISKHAIDSGLDSDLTKEQCSFLYMPFMHSEDLQEQRFAVDLYEKLGIETNYNFALAHRDIVARFGRFPHRNNILGRPSTDDEIEFLKQPNSSF